MTEAHTIPVLHKSTALLQAVADGNSGTVKGLSSTLDIPLATCYRIVRTFMHYNWLREDERGEYRIAFGLAHLARSYAGIEHRLTLLERKFLPLFEGASASTLTFCWS